MDPFYYSIHWCKPVAEAYGAEIVHKWDTKKRSSGVQCCDSGNNFNINLIFMGSKNFKNYTGHAVYARIATGNYRYIFSLHDIAYRPIGPFYFICDRTWINVPVFNKFF